MSDRPKKLIVDCATGAQVEFDLTDEEIAQMAVDAANAEAERVAKEAADAAAATAKDALLAKLGISADEAKLLLA